MINFRAMKTVAIEEEPNKQNCFEINQAFTVVIVCSNKAGKTNNKK